MFSSSTATAAGVACLAAFSSQVCAYPSWFSGDVAKAVPGGAFGQMGIINYAAGNSAVCEITSNIPAVGFTVGEAYTFKISTSNANGLGMVWDVSGTKGNSGTRRNPEKEVAWTATGDSAFAYAICGAGGGFRGVHVAASVTVKKKATTTTTGVFSFALGPLCAPCWHVLLRRVVGAGWVCG